MTIGLKEVGCPEDCKFRASNHFENWNWGIDEDKDDGNFCCRTSYWNGNCSILSNHLIAIPTEQKENSVDIRIEKKIGLLLKGDKNKIKEFWDFIRKAEKKSSMN